jgi:hypothetical protein
MKFHVLVVLPVGTPTADPVAVRAEVAQLMSPFRRWGGAVPPEQRQWGWYWIGDRDSLRQMGRAFARLRSDVPDHDLAVFKVARLSASMVPSVVLTPDAKWHQWPNPAHCGLTRRHEQAKQLLKRFASHHGAWVVCHRQ